MIEIRRVVRQAAWRLLVVDVFRVLAVTLTAVLTGLLVVRLVEKALSVVIPWPEVFAGAGAGALVGALAWSVARRARGVAVAREVDERAGLREALSTAWCVSGSNEPWDRVVVETARAKAVDVRVARVVPIRAPRIWPIPAATGLALALVWMAVPDMDLLGRLSKRQTAQEQERQVLAVRADIQKKDEALAALLAKANVDVKKEQGDAPDEGRPEGSRPEDLQRAAVKKLTNLTERLKEMQSGERSRELESVRQAMERLKQPGPGPLDQMSRELARGNFANASKALEELARKMQTEGMNPEEKKQLEAQLRNMAEQLAEAARRQDDLRRQLEKAGLDAKSAEEMARRAASDPEAVRRAIEQLQGLSPEQKEALSRMAQAASRSAGQSDGMSQAMARMAAAMAEGEMGQEAQQAMQDLAGQLSDLEMLQGEMANLDRAMREASRQLAELSECLGNCEGDGLGEGPGSGKIGKWREGESNRFGDGSGGPGKGSGPSVADSPAAFTQKKEKALAPTGQGPIIGSRLVFGEQVKGESRAEFAAAVEAGAKATADAIEEHLLPRELHDAAKHYFGTLAEKVKAEKVEPPPKPDGGGGS